MTEQPRNRWTKGMKSPNPAGRPPRTTERQRLDILLERCNDEKWAEIVDAAIRCAIDGDAKARDWLSAWCLPRPDAAAASPVQFAGYTLKVAEAAPAASSTTSTSTEPIELVHKP